MTNVQGELPYETGDGERTQGWSGSEASHDRARAEAWGVASARQRRVMSLLISAGSDGLTWKEIADRTGHHHGQVTGTLSVLHKTNHIARLRARRGKCSIYVMPGYVDDRLTTAFKANTKIAIPALPVPTSSEWEAIEYVRDRRRRQDYAIVCIPHDTLDAVLGFIDRAIGRP